MSHLLLLLAILIIACLVLGPKGFKEAMLQILNFCMKVFIIILLILGLKGPHL